MVKYISVTINTAFAWKKAWYWLVEVSVGRTAACEFLCSGGRRVIWNQSGGYGAGCRRVAWSGQQVFGVCVCSMFLWAWVSWGSFLRSSGVSCETELHISTHNIHIGTKLRFQNKVCSSPSFFILLFTWSVNHLLCPRSISRRWECTDV